MVVPPPQYTFTIKKTVSYWCRLDRVPFFLFCSWQLRLSRLQGFKLQIMDVQYFWRCVFRSESLYISPLIVPLLLASATLHFYVVCLLCQEKRRPTQNIVRQTTVRDVNITQVDCSFLIVHIKDDWPHVKAAKQFGQSNSNSGAPLRCCAGKPWIRPGSSRWPLTYVTLPNTFAALIADLTVSWITGFIPRAHLVKTQQGIKRVYKTAWAVSS